MERVKQFAAQLGVGSGVTALERKSADDVCITMAIRSPLCKARKGGFKDARYVPSIMVRIPCADPATGQTSSCLRSSRCASPFPTGSTALTFLPQGIHCPIWHRPCSHRRHICRHCPHSRCSVPGALRRTGCRHTQHCPDLARQPLLLERAYVSHGHCEPDSCGSD